MKNLYRFSLLIVMFLCAVAANAQHKIIKAVDSNETTHNYFYNDKGQLVWEIYGLNARIYVYNEAGQNTITTQYSWVAADNAYKAIQEETCTYDADGNLTEKNKVENVGTIFEVKWTYKYYDYVNGIATYYDEYKNGSLYYMYKQLPEYDSSNRLVKCVVMYADPVDYTNPTHETVSYDDKDKETTKTYGADGYVTEENDGKTTYTYTYTDLKAEYAPANFKAEIVGNQTALSWDAVDGAQKYILTYEQKVEEVTGTSKTVTVGEGERWFAVQAVIGGVVRNASVISSTMTDAGKLPVTDLAVGEMTRSEEATESDKADSRVFYNIPLTWTLPEGHSEIVKIVVYYKSVYGNDSYKTVGETIENAEGKEDLVVLPNATSYTLRVDPFEVAEWDSNNKPYKGIDTPVYLRIVYTTGESEKSNIVYVNPFDKFDNPAGINNATVNTAKSAVRKYIENGKVVIEKNNKKIGVDAIEIK